MSWHKKLVNFIKMVMLYWDKYSKEAHIGVTQMYVDDPRFSEYYERIAPGCAVFLEML